MNYYIQLYLQAILEHENGEDGKPLSCHYAINDFSDESIEKAIQDWNKFEELIEHIWPEKVPSDIVAYFYYTRAGHGITFLDSEWDQREELNDIVESNFDEINVYVDFNQVIIY